MTDLLYRCRRPRRRRGDPDMIAERLEPRQLLSLGYVASPLPAIDQAFHSAVISAMNAEGDLVGAGKDAAGVPHGFVYHQGRVIRLDDPANIDQRFTPSGINDSLEMSGTLDAFDIPVPAVAVYSAQPTPHWTTAPLFVRRNGIPVVTNINNYGQVAGGYSNPGTLSFHPGYWAADGSFHEITGPGNIDTVGINDAGALIGQQNHVSAYVWDGQIRSLGSIGGRYTEPAAINDSGEIVGQGSIAQGGGNAQPIYHPFVYVNGVMHDLGTLGADSGDRFIDFARDVNNGGLVVGVASFSPAKGHAFVYDGIMHDLNDLTTNVPPGWVLYQADFVNDRGQILVEGRAPNGDATYFLLNPVALPPGQISGSVWNDLNHNGIRDGSEAGLARVTVFIDTHHDGFFHAGDPFAVTDLNGHFAFNGLGPGTYVLRQLVPQGFAVTAPLSYSATITLQAGQGTATDFADVALSTVPIDFSYLLTLVQNYGHAGTFALGDLDGDGWVGFGDLLALGQHFGRPLRALRTA